MCLIFSTQRKCISNIQPNSSHSSSTKRPTIPYRYVPSSELKLRFGGRYSYLFSSLGHWVGCFQSSPSCVFLRSTQMKATSSRVRPPGSTSPSLWSTSSRSASGYRRECLRRFWRRRVKMRVSSTHPPRPDAPPSVQSSTTTPGPTRSCQYATDT